MKVEEYSKLMENPAEFILKVIVPRTSENLSDPGSIRYVATLTKLMLEMQRCMDTYVKTLTEVRERGMPALALGFTEAPLDFIGDFMRHPTNIPVDLYRHPDEVKRAAEAILPLLLKFAEASTPKKPLAPLPRLLYIPLHLNEMLSPKLYNEFYWPHLKKLITEACNKGVKPLIFFRGDHSPHIDTILELPRGWGIGYFERPKDFIKDVWRKLKGHTVVMGGIPNTLLREGTPEKIDEYVKNLLREVGPEPGFILAPGVEEIEPTTPTINVKALINAALKYGEYRR
jgi:uroporphyrinogen-III decarboxylase